MAIIRRNWTWWKLFGAKRQRGFHGKLKRSRGTFKQPVFGIFERDGRAYAEIVPDCTKATLQAVILGKVDVNSIIYSDGWRGYNGLVDVGYDKHFRVNHSNNEFAHGNCHIRHKKVFGVSAKDGLLNLTVLLPTLNATIKNVNGVGIKILALLTNNT